MPIYEDLRTGIICIIKLQNMYMKSYDILVKSTFTQKFLVSCHNQFLCMRVLASFNKSRLTQMQLKNDGKHVEEITNYFSCCWNGLYDSDSMKCGGTSMKWMLFRKLTLEYWPWKSTLDDGYCLNSCWTQGLRKMIPLTRCVIWMSWSKLTFSPKKTLRYISTYFLHK